MAKIFFISPVRLSTPESKEDCRHYVENLEKDGHQVHWPIRDTDQSDTVGIKICDANLRKILESDEIHVWLLPTSTGIHFDLGATYMLIFLGYEKKVLFAEGNKEKFENEYFDKDLLTNILEADTFYAKFAQKDMRFHFMLGAFYMLTRIIGYEKKIVFVNRKEFADEISKLIESQRKDYLLVLDYLDKDTPSMDWYQLFW